MAERFFISDTHFSHARILEFESDDGRPVRSGFSSVEEMDEAMIERWNSVVGPKDKVYHLGDVAIRVAGPGGLSDEQLKAVALVAKSDKNAKAAIDAIGK